MQLRLAFLQLCGQLPVSQAPAAASNGVAKASSEAATASDEAAELEKRKARAARFGVPLNMSDDKKREMRAQRCAAPNTGVEIDAWLLCGTWD